MNLPFLRASLSSKATKASHCTERGVCVVDFLSSVSVTDRENGFRRVGIVNLSNSSDIEARRFSNLCLASPHLYMVGVTSLPGLRWMDHLRIRPKLCYWLWAPLQPHPCLGHVPAGMHQYYRRMSWERCIIWGARIKKYCVSISLWKLPWNLQSELEESVTSGQIISFLSRRPSWTGVTLAETYGLLDKVVVLRLIKKSTCSSTSIQSKW